MYLGLYPQLAVVIGEFLSRVSTVPMHFMLLFLYTNFTMRKKRTRERDYGIAPTFKVNECALLSNVLTSLVSTSLPQTYLSFRCNH